MAKEQKKDYRNYKKAVAQLINEVSLLRYKQAVFDTAMVLTEVLKDAAPEEHEKLITATAATLLQEANEKLQPMQQDRKALRETMSNNTTVLFDDIVTAVANLLEVQDEH